MSKYAVLLHLDFQDGETQDGFTVVGPLPDNWTSIAQFIPVSQITDSGIFDARTPQEAIQKAKREWDWKPGWYPPE